MKSWRVTRASGAQSDYFTEGSAFAGASLYASLDRDVATVWRFTRTDGQWGWVEVLRVAP